VKALKFRQVCHWLVVWQIVMPCALSWDLSAVRTCCAINHIDGCCWIKVEQERQYTCNMWHICRTIVAVEKQWVLHTLSVSVVLVVQHAKCMCHIILLSVACPAVPYFSTLFHKQNDFEEKNIYIVYKMCVLIFITTFAWNISHSEKNSLMYCHKCTLVFM